MVDLTLIYTRTNDRKFSLTRLGMRKNVSLEEMSVKIMTISASESMKHLLL